MPGQNPAPGNAGPVRNTPLDNRAIRSMEILSGQAGEPLDHAVRFRDIQELEAKLLDTIQRNSSIFSVALARRIESQFQAIDTESKGVAQEITASFQTLEGPVATFSETFTDALDTTNANIATNYYTIAQTDSAIAALETSVTTELNGLETSVTTLSGSVDGIEGVHAIQIDNNGYISGFGLISSIRDGLPVSDFIVSDASFKVVNTSGAGNYTPFAVFPTTRVVDGVTVPAGVYAQELFVTNANIQTLSGDKIIVNTLNGNKITANTITSDKINVSELSAITANLGTIQVGSANIANLAVERIKIAAGAVTSFNLLRTNVSFTGATTWGSDTLIGSHNVTMSSTPNLVPERVILRPRLDGFQPELTTGQAGIFECYFRFRIRRNRGGVFTTLADYNEPFWNFVVSNGNTTCFYAGSEPNAVIQITQAGSYQAGDILNVEYYFNRWRSLTTVNAKVGVSAIVLELEEYFR